jgi:hypothetical protein
MEGAKDTTWSADTHDLEVEGSSHNRHESSGTERGGDQEEDEFHLLHGTEAEQGHHPGRRWEDDPAHRYGDGPDDDHHYDGPPQYQDTEYRGAHSSYQPPSSLSPDQYEQSSAAFPSAPYGYTGPNSARH